MSARLRLIVPCYNEAHRLEARPFVDFLAACPDAGLLFVNDGSTDNTSEVLARIGEAGPRIGVLELPHNRGKAEAVRAGILEALRDTPEYVGFWDADLSTPFSDLPPMLDALDRRPEVDIVMGSRVRLLGREIHRRTTRHYTGRVFATAASLALRLPVYDTQCGAKILRANHAIRQVFERPFDSPWVMDVEILSRYIQAVGRQDAARGIVEIPLNRWTDVGGSKLRLSHIPAALLTLAKVRRALSNR